MVTQDAPSYPLYSNLFGRQAHELKALLGQAFTQPLWASAWVDESGPEFATPDRGGLGDSSLRSEWQRVLLFVLLRPLLSC